MSAIATAADGQSDGDWIGTVKEFPEIKISGTTKIAVLARVKAKVKKAIEDRRAQGQKIPAGKMKVTVKIEKKSSE
jgi:predicted RNase H-like HicB family nuclease